VFPRLISGKHAVNALLRESYAKSSTAKQYPIADREAAVTVIAELHQNGFFLKAQKEPKSKFLTLVGIEDFQEESYYFWIYEVTQWRGMLMGFGIVLIVLAGVLFPLWPSVPRQGVYYLSMLLLGFIGFIMGLGVVRAILWLALKLTIGRGGWLFPNLFADVGFVESFIPVWA
jgi:translocation protein SEC62